MEVKIMPTNKAFRKGTKGESIVQSALEVVNRYPDIEGWTLRQIYYRLVSDMVFANTINNYKTLSRLLVKGRKLGVFPYEKMVDRDRRIISNIDSLYDNWKDEVDSKIENIRDPPYIIQTSNLLQEKITLVVLEKKALTGIFESVIGSMCILVVCKGFNSLTQIKNLVDMIGDDDREINCYCFSDYDPSGVCIQDNFKRQCEELGLTFNKFERRALTLDLIREYKLPGVPAKTTDTRSKSWTGGDVVELDALEPNVLKELIKDCIKENFNEELYNIIRKIEKIHQRRAKKRYAKKLQELAKNLIDKS